MTISDSPLRHAIQGLYRTFGDGPLGRPLYGCECCSDPQVLARLADTPLRQLTYEDLRDYQYSAISTIGDEDDFKHFFPRLLELAVDSDVVSIDVEELGTQLARAHWQQWPQSEHAAVSAALEALWQSLLTEDAEEFHIDSTICALGLAGLDLLPRLTAWNQSTDSIARTNLLRFKDHNRESLSEKRRLANPFWDGSPKQEVLVADWLRTAMGVH